MVLVESIDGTKIDVDCIGCALQKGKLKRFGGIITETDNFDVQQDYEVPIVGFFVIASKRHLVGFHEFNEKEKKEFMDLLCKLRKGMKEVLNITYVKILFREDTIESKQNPSHFHIALLPIYPWIGNLSSIEIFEYAKKKLRTKKNIVKVKNAVNKMKRYFSK